MKKGLRKIERSVKIKAELLHPNPWNPYASKSDRLQAAIAESINEFDQIQDIVCRPHPEKPGEYQILDGEGRHRTFVDGDDVFVTVIHGLQDFEAKKITIVMDETRATADQEELSSLLAELSLDYSIEDLNMGLPYLPTELSDLIATINSESLVIDKNNSQEGSTKEINPDEFKLDHQCPKCGFEYNDKK